jgi:hypothetical protein
MAEMPPMKTADAPWESARGFDTIYEVAKARGIEVEF